MKRISKLIAAALLLACVCSPAVFAAGTKENVFSIDSMEDFNHFSRNCRNNTWSDGMTVELNTDLDFRGRGRSGSVAFFNGTFHGNSHKIVNLESQSPLFQTIGEKGSVSDLMLSVSISSSRDNTAALVSENNGSLEKITVEGSVSGKATASLLAAVNKETGTITGCEVSGHLTANNSAGGIAGKNQGVITACVNRADINTNVDDSRISTEDIKDILENVLLTKSLNDTENLRTRIDTGGIAGYNMAGGVISGCSNEGIIGYPHNGYNTGGICGRTGGVVENCENRGRIFGRRSTGGITGKQQPEITLDFSEDVLSAMSDEMDSINGLITDTLNTSETITESTYDRLNGLSRSMTEVKNNTNVVYNASLQRFDEMSDMVNSSTAALTGSAEDIAADTEGLSESFDSLSRMTGNIDAAIDDLTEGFSLTNEERQRIISLNSQIREDLNTTIPFADEVRNNRLPELPEERSARISQGLSGVSRLAGNVRAMKTLLTALRNQRDRIADGSIQTEASRRDRALSSSVSNVLDSTDELDTAVSRLSSFASSLGGNISSAAGGVNLDLQANPAVRKAGNDIYAGLDSISGQLDSMNAGAREDSLEVIQNLNEINTRFSNLTELLRNERDRLNNIADNGGIFTDTSDTVNSASRIVSCKNNANIAGDTQTGGIAGTIGIEYDLDPDEDILKSNNRSLDYSFGVSAAIQNTVNTGSIGARENHAGGIVGKADMGSLRKNTNEGDVSSEDGYFVGGIAGYTEASLDENTARCRVTGLKNVGGICGNGKVLKNNLAAVTVLGTEEYAGAIAGSVDSLNQESIQNNLYYTGNFGAIDNIDYAGMAEKSAEPMKQVLVKFMVNRQLAALEEVPSGTVLKDVPHPEPELPAGFYLRWNLDPETVLTEDTVVDSAYCLLTAALASPEKAPGTDKPLLIVDGKFRENDALTFREEGEYHFFVSVPEDGLSERKIRVLKPVYRLRITKKEVSRKCHVTVNGTEVPTELFGEYLVFTTGDRELEITVTEEALPVREIAIGAAAVLLLLMLLLVRAKIKRAKKAKITESQKAESSKPEEKDAAEQKPEDA